jgi:hypothetical protein
LEKLSSGHYPSTAFSQGALASTGLQSDIPGREDLDLLLVCSATSEQLILQQYILVIRLDVLNDWSDPDIFISMVSFFNDLTFFEDQQVPHLIS